MKWNAVADNVTVDNAVADNVTVVKVIAVTVADNVVKVTVSKESAERSRDMWI